MYTEQKVIAPSSRRRQTGFAGPQTQKPPRGWSLLLQTMLEQVCPGDRCEAWGERRPAKLQRATSSERPWGLTATLGPQLPTNRRHRF